jgi:glycosyltransferase involved in cell wall biosynthesis
VLGPELAAQKIAESDIDAFVEAIRRVLRSAELREQAGARARHRAVTQHSLSRMLSDYERLYRERASWRRNLFNQVEMSTL